MTIDELISELEVLKGAHGGSVEVTVWQYGGGNYDLHDVHPKFDLGLQRVLLETTLNSADIQQ